MLRIGWYSRIIWKAQTIAILGSSSAFLADMRCVVKTAQSTYASWKVLYGKSTTVRRQSNLEQRTAEHLVLGAGKPRVRKDHAVAATRAELVVRLFGEFHVCVTLPTAPGKWLARSSDLPFVQVGVPGRIADHPVEPPPFLRSAAGEEHVGKITLPVEEGPLAADLSGLLDPAAILRRETLDGRIPVLQVEVAALADQLAGPRHAEMFGGQAVQSAR